MKDPMENAPTGATGKERSRHDPEAGALIITRPQTPGRCQFTLLVPHEVTRTVVDCGAAY